MKNWKQLLGGLLAGVLLSGLMHLMLLPKSGTPLVIVTLTPNRTPDPTATIEMIRVHIAGAVNNPGVYTIPKGANINDAILVAGGPGEDANINLLNLAKLLEDEQRLYIPNQSDSQNLELADPSRSTTIGILPLININTATQAELESLPGIGVVKAKAIIDYRTQNGYFIAIEDLLNVSGIGESTFGALKDLISVSP